jgi:acetoin utilization protein AcuB
MFVEDYMTADPVTIREDARAVEAERLMRRHHFRQIPVLDEGDRLTGIITDRDIRQTIGLDEGVRGELVVSELMSAEPVTIPVNATLDLAIQLLSKYKFGAIPVLDANRLVGIISYIDVLRALADILGLDQPGYRVELALPDGFADIARAFEALKGLNGTVLAAVVSRTRRDGGEPSLYLRIHREQRDDVEQRLRHATLVLLEPEHD